MAIGQTYVDPELPPLDHLPPASFRSVFFATLGALPDELKADRRFLWAYVHLTRVTDKAIREYGDARDAAREGKSIVLSGPVVDPEDGVNKAYYATMCTDHLETCVDTTHRAVSAVKLLRDKGIGIRADIPDPDAAGRLERIRHAMQHTIDRLIGEGLRRGRLPFGVNDPYGINPQRDRLVIGAEDPLSYVQLVGLMESCYRAAKVIGGGP